MMNNTRRSLPLRHPSTRRNSIISLPSLLICFGLATFSFYGGILIGYSQGRNQGLNECSGAKGAVDNAIPSEPEPDEPLPQSSSSAALFPDPMKQLFQGMARVDRDDFGASFDLGVPLDKTTPGNQEVLLLYSGQKMLPKKYNRHLKQSKGEIPKLSAQEATEQCTTMKVVLTEGNRRKQHCFAIMGQWDSYHVHKLMRVPEKSGVAADLSFPLRYVSRLYQEGGKVNSSPSTKNMDMFREMLVQYYLNMPEVIAELKPLARKVAKLNTIVVMVCNFGQAELLMNFACSARARGLDTSQILLFATDTATKELAEGLGMSVFYDARNFADMPEQAASRYADRTFSRMMMAKVYCVHLINRLGYDVLFQDVDVVWYRDPVGWFHNSSSPLYHFDMYFQDDGAHTPRYAPYSPNTGFYFVRNNEVTQHFFDTFVRMGDLIVQSGSHQGALTSVINEFASWRGLRVKVISRDSEEAEFPGGFHYHRRKQFMFDMIKKKVAPYIFHMSWTENKNNKKKFFQQMGDFFVNEKCSGKTAKEIGGGDLQASCCLAEPDFKCHYRDKPSIRPCKDSPPIDKGKPSWW